MIAARQIAFGGGKRKPYKRKVEYLEGTGTQWIDTGYVPKVPISERYLLECTVPPITADWQTWFGARTSDSERTVLWRQRQNAVDTLQTYVPKSDANYYTHTTVARATVGTRIWCNINPVGGFYSFDGVAYSSLGDLKKHGTVSTIQQKSVCLFSGNHGAVQALRRVMKVYKFTIEDYATGDILIRLIPVVDWNNEPCMYDEVSGELFYNQGTGNFIIGDDL